MGFAGDTKSPWRCERSQSVRLASRAWEDATRPNALSLAARKSGQPDLRVIKRGPELNVADILTKSVPQTLLDRHMATMGFEHRLGRSAKAKKVLGAVP